MKLLWLSISLDVGLISRLICWFVIWSVCCLVIRLLSLVFLVLVKCFLLRMVFLSNL